MATRLSYPLFPGCLMGGTCQLAACKKGQGAETMVGKNGTMEEVELRGRELGREELSTGAFPTLVVKKTWLITHTKAHKPL